MKAIRIAAIVLILLIVGGIVVFKSLVKYVPVGKVGVRTQQYAVLGDRGVVPEDFGPGWQRDLGPIDTWVLFDSTVQTLEMTRDPSRGAVHRRDDVQVQSADGYTVSVDVTVKYRITPGKAHKLYQDTGARGKYHSIVRNEAEQACIGLLGDMNTEDFYNPHERRTKAQAVLERLRDSLSGNYVNVIDVLIRDVQFDDAYEKKIRRKKLADQEVELNKSLKVAREMAGKTQVIEAETKRLVSVIQKEKEAELVRMRAEADRQIATIRAEAEREATEKKADADLEAAQAQAKGELLVKKAEAEGERLRNEAMTGVGGSILVALEAARNLNLSDVTVSTVDMDLLDVEAMATRLGVPEDRADR